MIILICVICGALKKRYGRNSKTSFVGPGEEEPYVNHLEIDFQEIEEGRVVGRMPLKPEQRQYSGVVHGGVLAAFADTVAGFAAYTMTPTDRDVLTAELKTSFLRAAWGDELVGIGHRCEIGVELAVCRV